jgi:hypothetical protein
MAGLDSWLGLLGEAGEEAREVFQDTDMERMTAKHEPPDLGTAVRMAAVSPGWDLSRARPAVGILL